MPRKNTKPTEKINLTGCGVLLGMLAILVIVSSINIVSNTLETPEQKAAKQAQAQKEKVNKEKEMVDRWFEGGSEYGCEGQLKEQLRDPNSYERDGDFTTLSNDGVKRTITWKFRSKNGFGGYAPAVGICLITKEKGGTVKATVIGE